ncbi:Queuosine salvage protein [Eumeta japonica]|uniref:Queuosine 5'-phosphate N-glycosylase/hydrolase n=1 Tax=Eumeta variegata TaxID=151549 RepID=A0A4C1VUF2_EUMVA|nr:Queuosine salvage protein [Eumeta japonica]
MLRDGVMDPAESGRYISMNAKHVHIYEEGLERLCDEEGFDIANPNFYSKITEEQLRHIMRGDNEISIPLFEQRLKILHEVGLVLIDKFKGTFEECVKQANKSAVKLLEIVLNNFDCFVDEGIYKGKKVSFYKRAQILVADLWNFFGGENWGKFVDIDKLTMFADYRVPQVLAHFGVLVYSDDLKRLIIKGAGSIENGSDLEMEIRGCSIHAVQLLKEKIEQKVKSKEEKVEVPNSALIDYFLWCYRRKHAKEVEVEPFHKTYCIYY